MSEPEVSGDHGAVVAVVAAKDAADTVADTVAGLLGVAGVDEVVVVDDGSSDETSARAIRAGAWVLRLPANQGKGGAVAAGVGLAPHARVYLLVDADVGPTASAVEALLAPVMRDEADMAVGVLPGAGKKGGFGLVRRMAAAGIRRATGEPVDAPLSGQRAVRGDLLRSLVLAPRFGLEAALTIDARRAGARVMEVPVDMDHRHTGRTVSGFSHRGRQGADIGRALWPRLTRPRGRIALIALALAVSLLGAFWSGGRWEASSIPLGQKAQKVLIFGMPGLRWDEVGTGRLPNLDRLIHDGALAAMTVRTLSRQPSPAESYATFGAGARVQAGAPAEDAHNGDGGQVVVEGAAAARRGAGPYVSSKPGALGDALHAAGLRTAVVGNSDTPSGLAGLPGLHPVRRPAAVALMDRAGLVDAGSVDAADLLMADRAAPFGERADPDRVVARTAEAMDQADVVLVDPGDLDRVADLAGIAPAGYADLFRSETLAATDALLGRLVAEAPPGTLVLVVSTRPPTAEWRLAPLVVSGPGVTHGYIHSPSTRRLGLVTLTDLAPTVLAAFGAEGRQPEGMVGHALRYHAADPSPAALGRQDADVAHRERIYLPIAVAFIALQAVAYSVIAVLATRPRRPRWAWLMRDVALAIAAFPLGTLLFRFATLFVRGGGWGVVALLPALVALVVLAARRARSTPVAPLAWIFSATVWVLVLDIGTGGRLQVAGILGYSPQSAGRFFGIGNTAFAVLAACAILAAALHVQKAPRRWEAVVAAAAFLALVVVVDGAPSLGDDVGGILTLVPVCGLTLFALAGRRVTWKKVAAAAAAAVAVLALVTAVDLMRPPDARTHLGQLAANTRSHGAGALATTIARKAEADVRLLRLTPWSWAVPVIAGYLLYVLVARRRWTDLLPPGSPLRVGVLGALAAGVLGFAVNDSGVVVIALALVEIGPLLAILALEGGAGAGPLPDAPTLLEPARDTPSRPSHPSHPSLGTRRA